MKRPLQISIAGWFIAVTAGLSILSLLAGYLNPETRGVVLMSGQARLMMMALNSAINILSALAILKGKNWGRYLYLAITAASMTYDWELSGFDVYDFIGVTICLCLLAALFTKQSNSYFKPAEQSL